MTPGARLAAFATSPRLEDLPPEAVERVKTALLDYTGALFAGLDEESAALARRTAGALGGNPQAAVWGAGTRTSSALAALANGTAAHALELDDTNWVMVGHPSVQMLPALCALAESEQRGGREVIVAYVAGFEVGAALGRALNPDHMTQGWFPVGTIGPLMAAAACARLLRLAPEATLMALGLAANMAAGLRCNNGSMAKALAAGQAASNGLVAALLARDGGTANPAAIEDRFGYFDNFSHRDPADLDRALATLGERLEILDSGISFKLYPCCAAAHGAVDCALEARQARPADADSIETVEVSIHASAKSLLMHPRPRTASEARFSLEYCVSRALVDGALGLAQFARPKLDEPRVRALMERVRPAYLDFPLRNDGTMRYPVTVRLRHTDGFEVTTRVEHPRGSPKRPVGLETIREKFMQCSAAALEPERAHAVAQAIAGLDRLESFEGLAALVRDRRQDRG